MNTSEGMALGGFFLVLFIFLGIMMLISLVLLVIYFVALWKLFVKAGHEGWKAIIPIYNTLVMSQIATGNYKLGIASLCISVGYSALSGVANAINSIATSGDGSLAALSLVSLPLWLIGLVLSIGMAVLGGYFHYLFTKSFGKETVWCVLSIFFFPIIMLILAFDKKTVYVGPQETIQWFA